MMSLWTPELNVMRRVQGIIRRLGCRSALDVGAGTVSVLTALRGEIHSTAIDAFAPSIEAARTAGLHDEYLLGDVMEHDLGGARFDAVVANEVIEHLDKWKGYELLRRLDQIALKVIIITTPNGFQPQGPEYGNPWQRHRSGWFAHDFEGLGYDVEGIFGPRALRGYAGQPRWRGARLWVPVSELMGKLLSPWPALHYGLLAVKVMEDVPVRLGERGRR
jgi:hypothetical protein